MLAASVPFLSAGSPSAKIVWIIGVFVSVSTWERSSLEPFGERKWCVQAERRGWLAKGHLIETNVKMWT